MPKCKPWCPLVKLELKRIATEAPWLLKKDLSTDDDQTTIAAKARDSALDIVDEKFISARSHTKYDEEWEKAGELKKIPDGVPDHRRYRRDVRVSQMSKIDTAIDATKDVSSKDQATELAKMQAETATQAKEDKAQDDKLVETDAVERTTRPAGGSVSEVTEGTDMEKAKEETADGREDIAMFRDECDPSCPRRISQKSRIRKLEERQRIIDEYLLNKGSGYFEDVCTCSLSCVIRALRNDSFIRSTLLSAALFALGLKLCSELDAWYLPIRFS